MDSDNLWADIKNSNRKSFDTLVYRFNESLTAFAYHIVKNRETAEDIVQDVFVYIWLHRHQIKFEGSFQSLLYVSVRNLAYNHLRSCKRLNLRLQEFSEEEKEEVSVVGYMIQEEALRLLEEAIACLPERTAQVIRLTLDGLKQEEIAKTMEVTVANVKRLKNLGITRLKQILGKEESIILLLINMKTTVFHLKKECGLKSPLSGVK